MVHRATLLFRILQTQSHGATPYCRPCNRLFLKDYQEITVEDGPKDAKTLVVGRRQLEEARCWIVDGEEKKVDLVSLGCPLYAIEDLKKVASSLSGKRVHPQVRLWVWTDNATRSLATEMGLIQLIKGAGGQVLAGTCPVTCPLDNLGHGFHTMVTDSAKTAGFMRKGGQVETHLANLDQCVAAAISRPWMSRPV